MFLKWLLCARHCANKLLTHVASLSLLIAYGTNVIVNGEASLEMLSNVKVKQQLGEQKFEPIFVRLQNVYTSCDTALVILDL